MKILITGGLGNAARGGVVQSLEKDFELRLTHYKEPERKCRYEFVKADLRDYKDMRMVVKGIDAVVHLGAKAGPGAEPFLVYSTNVLGTANLLEAAFEEGIKKFVYGSSVHVYGIPLDNIPFYNADYLPLDEEHPVRPYIPYEFSKVLSENLGEGYMRRGVTSFISLRIGGICHNVPLRGHPYSGFRKENIGDGARGLWNHIDARDLGQLIRLCLKSDIEGFEVFNAVAEDHIFPEVSSMELIKKFCPYVKKIYNKGEFVTKCDRSFISIEKAKKMLGYKPEYNFRDYQRWLREGKKEEDYYETSDVWQSKRGGKR